MVDLSLRYVAPSDADAGTSASSAAGGRPLIGLSLVPPDAPARSADGAACPKSGAGGHELRVSVLGSAGTSVTDIDVQDGPGQSSTARLQVSGPRGESVIEVQVGQGSMISVRIGRARRATPVAGVAPLGTSQAAPSDQRPMTDEGDLRPAVPARFRRAFASDQTPSRGDD